MSGNHHLKDPTRLLKEIAFSAKRSARSLQRDLRARGLCFRPMRNSAREHAAKALLLAGTDRITDIAVRLGYSDASSFCRAFKRWTGQTPGQFAARQRRESAP